MSMNESRLFFVFRVVSFDKKPKGARQRGNIVAETCLPQCFLVCGALTNSTLSLSTQLHNWIPAKNCWGNLVMDYHPIRGGGWEVWLQTADTRVKRGRVGHECNFTFFVISEKYLLSQKVFPSLNRA